MLVGADPRLLTDDLIRGDRESFCRYEISSVQRSWTGEIAGPLPAKEAVDVLPTTVVLSFGLTAFAVTSGRLRRAAFTPALARRRESFRTTDAKSAEAVFRQACEITASCPEKLPAMDVTKK
ncbi:MAG: hypothetical protein ABIP48_05805 [Planctomycetota bacterium]